ncbi:MAG: hypothetical protein KGS48_10430 [Bacteroidetes bacterium]|nr:hypothetical protein [Bacteroidota bacterium]
MFHAFHEFKLIAFLLLAVLLFTTLDFLSRKDLRYDVQTPAAKGYAEPDTPRAIMPPTPSQAPVVYNPLLQPASYNFHDAENQELEKPHREPPFWAVYLKAYPRLEEAEHLRNAFQQRPIGIAIRPDGSFLAYIHFDQLDDCRACARDINRHLLDLRPFGITKPLEIVDLAPVSEADLLSEN